METIKTKAHIDSEGVLKVLMPKELANSDAEVIVIYTIQPKEELEDWATFIEQTYGSLADDPLELPDKLMPEIRDEME